MKKWRITIFVLDIICAILWGMDVIIQFTKDEPSIVMTALYIFLCALWSFKGGMDVLNLWED